MRDNVERLIISGITAHSIAAETGLPRNSVYRIFTGETELSNVKFGTIEILNQYYLKEMERMEKTQWEFDNYTVYDEGDVLRFENDEDDTIGYVSNHEGDLVDDLNNGADPIADGWEDGVGNTINIDGWGDQQ